jgi:hypothetical protein
MERNHSANHEAAPMDKLMAIDLAHTDSMVTYNEATGFFDWEFLEAIEELEDRTACQSDAGFLE